MPIEGRTLWEAARQFCDHLNHVLATTVTQTRLMVLRPRAGPRIQVSFRESGGQPATARLHTRFGPMGLYLGQVCESPTAPDGRQRLLTIKYAYTLTPEGADEPLWRWEYVRDQGEGEEWCRHHLQGDVPVRIGQKLVSLNDLHLPTGYVTIEEILRFCIVDLRVRPLSDDWHQILEASYRQFKEEFAARGTF